MVEGPTDSATVRCVKISHSPHSSAPPLPHSSTRAAAPLPQYKPVPTITPMAKSPQHWLVKSEPDSFSIQDLAKAPRQTTCWDGVRNYQARNFLRDGMKLGDRVLFYHSSVDPPCVVGIAVVAREAYPDHTAWDKKSAHFDPKASADNPIWQMVDLKLEEVFSRPISIDELRQTAGLANMELLKRGSRLSVQPVSRQEFDAIVKLARGKR